MKEFDNEWRDGGRRFLARACSDVALAVRKQSADTITNLLCKTQLPGLVDLWLTSVLSLANDRCVYARLLSLEIHLFCSEAVVVEASALRVRDILIRPLVMSGDVEGRARALEMMKLIERNSQHRCALCC